MFQAFKELHPQTIIMPRFYRDTVKKHFPKLSFQKPRKDTCDLLKTKLLNESSNRDDDKKSLELHHRTVGRNELVLLWNQTMHFPKNRTVTPVSYLLICNKSSLYPPSLTLRFTIYAIYHVIIWACTLETTTMFSYLCGTKV